jgi:hypothetical protein
MRLAQAYAESLDEKGAEGDGLQTSDTTCSCVVENVSYNDAAKQSHDDIDLDYRLVEAG